LRQLALIVAMAIAWYHPARAVPSFAAQTGQPCAACHVGAFGPQLRPFGRSFKLNGYTASDGKAHGPPVAASVYGSFTHTQESQPGGAARWFAPNDNPALDQASLYYAGAIDRHLGAFIQLTYDGVARQPAIDNTDIRLAREKTILGIDTVAGLTLNNNPTVSDLWNSTPAWGFPYNASALAPAPAAATRIDGSFGQRVLGIGAYVMWNDWVYTELDLYRGLGRDIRDATGIVPVAGTDSVSGTAPYWRLALQHDTRRISWEIGTYGIIADILPGGLSPGGRLDHFTDIAADANWQFTVTPRLVASDVISAHATIIHEDQDLRASSFLGAGDPHGHLCTARADLSYSIAATITPSAQIFSTTGSRDAAYWPTPAGSPDSSGAVLELAYTPFGKTDSAIKFGNIRLAAQYVLYSRFNGPPFNGPPFNGPPFNGPPFNGPPFNGQVSGAADNNTVYLSLWAAWHF
jgi:hypothetical protein